MECGSDGSPHQSLCMIRAAELFPKSQMEKEDTQLSVPFQELAGESVKYLGRTDDGVLALSNYRLFLLKHPTNSETSVPLGLIESAQSRDLFHLVINCKDASTVKCSFETAEQCSQWHRRIQLYIGVPETLESLFAFPFCSWSCDLMANAAILQNTGSDAIDNPPSSSCSMVDYSERLQRASRYEDDFMREVERLGFDLNGSWRISTANEDFRLCPSYPQKILVPCCISDETLYNVANFRGSRRLPAVVWRHRQSGAVIARCSQPEVGWLGWRNSKDEQLLKALADACAFDRGEQMRRLNSKATSTQTIPSGESSPSSPEGSHEEVALDEVRKILIVDARSYTSAVTNRARGGGCECIEYYPCAEIEFMNLGNIHVIRKSFQSLRQLCASPPDVPNWLGLLEKTMWLQHLSGLLAASMTVCHAIEKKGRPVLVHCSDGWDRTPQIVATAQLCLDPYYRTVEGFRTLVEREWLSFGHKFADRCGHGPGSDELNERCPVFLQWLDLVHQIHKQYPCSFEFSMGYLIKLAQHSLSCLFGTFLCNTLRERIENSVFERTFSVWPFLSGPMYRNPLYVPNREKVLWPAHNVRDLSLWTEVYLGSLGNQNFIDFPGCSIDGLHDTISPMSKTRSYGDLITADFIQNGISRRSSDPNMTVDPSLTIGSNSENESIADMHSEGEDSPDLLANLIHDTTKQLQNLTIEINNHDENGFETYRTKRPSNCDSVKVDVQAKENTTALRQQYNSSPISHATSGECKSHSAASDDIVFTSSRHAEKILQIDNDRYNGDNDDDDYDGENLYGLPLNEQSSKQSMLASVHSNATECHNIEHESVATPEESGNRGRMVSEVVSGVTIHKADNLNLSLMQSVDLEDPPSNGLTPLNGMDSVSMQADIQQDLWLGSVNTSTDTLVPIECKQLTGGNGSSSSSSITTTTTTTTKVTEVEPCQTNDETDSGCKFSLNNKNNDEISITSMSNTFSRDERKSISQQITHNGTNYNILPKVHCHLGTMREPDMRSITKINNAECENERTRSVNDNTDQTELSSAALPLSITQYSAMDESILIQPAHQKLEISISGKCASIDSMTMLPIPVTVTGTATCNASSTIAMPSTAASTPTTAITSASYPLLATSSTLGMPPTRRRRTSSSNSRRDGGFSRQANGCTISRFSLAGVRSLPMTPPGLPDRPQIAMSCPDGLAHALSEQNLRLQQIVHEHKLREDVLLREIHDMRMALLKKTCPHCNIAPAERTNDDQGDDFLNECRILFDSRASALGRCTCFVKRKRKHYRNCHDGSDGCAKGVSRQRHSKYSHHYRLCSCHSDQDNDCDCTLNANDDCDDDDDDEFNSSASACSALDNVENASVCSWEAVEDRSGPSSCASSSIQPANAASVLWVPDHAVSRCTSCQTEFWLGRRKHHCRSCGQIFCADCSEFWAPLPDEKLFSPVRLCGPCYHSVTTQMQLQQTHTQTHRSCIAPSLNGNSVINNMFLTTSVPAPIRQQLDERNTMGRNCKLPSPMEACNQAAAIEEHHNHFNHHHQNQCSCATTTATT